MSNYDTRSQLEKDLHMGKVMWVTNKALGQQFFDTEYITIINRYMMRHPKTTIEQLLMSDDYSMFKK